MEVRGPILPHTIHDMCELMKNANLGKFSLTFADVECTKSLTSATIHHIGRHYPAHVKKEIPGLY